jgi:hydrogenase nickel incorporation protein HypB
MKDLEPMRTPVIKKPASGSNPFLELNRRALRQAEIFTISVVGGPGCGKTTLIDATIERLMPAVQVGVIACDLVSHRDADRIARHSDQVVQITTGEAHALDAAQVHQALGSLDLSWIDLLFIENVGSLTGPADNDIGQDVTVAMFSVAAGDDKADRHPDLVRCANVILLNKTDLFGCAPFDVAAFRADVERNNGRAEVIQISALHARGIDQWLDWLRKRIKKAHQQVSHWFG